MKRNRYVTAMLGLLLFNPLFIEQSFSSSIGLLHLFHAREM